MKTFSEWLNGIQEANAVLGLNHPDDAAIIDEFRKLVMQSSDPENDSAVRQMYKDNVRLSPRIANKLVQILVAARRKVPQAQPWA